MSEESPVADSIQEESSSGRHRGKHKKDKPWDDETIDHWKQEEFKEDSMPHPLLEESSFATLFPAYREQYLREVWPQVTSFLLKFGIACELNLVEGTMRVMTTRKTWDPYAIIKARDLIRLLSRSVPFVQASKIMDDEMTCDIMKIRGYVRNKEKFAKRRQRLIGPAGKTLKALQILTGCYLLVQGNTVAVMGSFKGLKVVRRIIEDCMRNIHPIYHIKELMIKRELAKDPVLANENWDRFLPHFKKRNVKRKKPFITKTSTKEYTPFPPSQTPRKVDLQMESGEYFLKPEQKKEKELEEKRKRQAARTLEKKEQREEVFVPPSEKRSNSPASTSPSSVDVEELKKKLKKNNKRVATDTSSSSTSTSVSSHVGSIDTDFAPPTKRRKGSVSKKVTPAEPSIPTKKVVRVRSKKSISK